MEESTMLSFKDHDSGDEAFALVRVFPQAIGLVLSLKSDGDIQLVLAPRDCRRLIDALQRAVDASGEAVGAKPD
jgi:hypothetical protein